MSYEIGILLLFLGLILTAVSLFLSLCFTIAEQEPMYLFGLLALIISLPLMIGGGMVVSDPQKKYEDKLEQLRISEDEMAKFLVLHPEFKEIESERE